MAFPTPLDAIQRWFQAVITHPQGVVAGAEANDLQAARIDIDEIIAPSSRQTSADRVRVYSTAYFGRLLDCLQEEFPAVRYAVGEDAFAAFVFGYLQQYPSRSYTLSRLGEDFPRYLAETQTAAGTDGGVDQFSQFIVDLARLERIYSEVFDGSGAEGEAVLQTETLLAIPAEQWGDVRLTVSPSLRLELFGSAVDEYAAAVRHGNEADFPMPIPRRLAIHRQEYVVRRIPLSEPQHVLLSSLARGETLANAIAGTLETVQGGPDELAGQLRDWFKRWTAAGLFVRVE